MAAVSGGLVPAATAGRPPGGRLVVDHRPGPPSVARPEEHPASRRTAASPGRRRAVVAATPGGRPVVAAGPAAKPGIVGRSAPPAASPVSVVAWSDGPSTAGRSADLRRLA